MDPEETFHKLKEIQTEIFSHVHGFQSIKTFSRALGMIEKLMIETNFHPVKKYPKGEEPRYNNTRS